MSIFNKPSAPGAFRVLEVERDLDAVKERIVSFLATTSPAMMWSPKYAEAIGWKKFVILKGDHHLRGLASHKGGRIELRINESTRWMNNTSDDSTLAGKEDLTPTGVLAHEIGHQFMWAMERHGGDELMGEFYALKAKTSISGYGKTNGIEDFAETYRLWLLNPPLLRRLDPRRFDLLVRMDDHFANRTGFKHSTPRPLSNPQFALNRIRTMLSWGEGFQQT